MSSLVIYVYFPLFLKPNIAKMFTRSQQAKSAKIYCGFYYFSKNIFPNENLTKATILYRTVHCPRQKGQTVSSKHTLLAWKMENKPANLMAYNSI
jgi:hypothetical protein